MPVMVIGPSLAMTSAHCQMMPWPPLALVEPEPRPVRVMPPPGLLVRSAGSFRPEAMMCVEL